MTYITDDNKLTILKGMRELLFDPKSWTNDLYARDARGFVTDPEASDAVCWCTLGAGYKIANGIGIIIDGPDSSFDNEIGELLADCGPVRVPETSMFNPGVVLVAPWNDEDTRTHEDIIVALDCAIAKFE